MCDVKECEQRFGKVLDECIEIGVILALASSKRLEDDLVWKVAFAKPESEAVQSEPSTNTSKRARQDEGELQKSAITGSFSTTENDVEMKTMHAGKRQLEPSGDDDVCGLDMCDDLSRVPERNVSLSDSFACPLSCVARQVWSSIREEWGSHSGRCLVIAHCENSSICACTCSTCRRDFWLRHDWRECGVIHLMS